MKLLMRTLLASALACSAVLSTNDAHAQSPMTMRKSEMVPGVKLRNMSSYIGQHVTVFYVLATKPLISVNERNVNVSEVRHLMTTPVQYPEVLVPQVKLPTAGFRPAFNFVVIVVHDSANYVWTNADGLAPADPRGLAPRASIEIPSRIMTLSRAQMEAMSIRQGQPDAITVEL